MKVTVESLCCTVEIDTKVKGTPTFLKSTMVTVHYRPGVKVTDGTIEMDLPKSVGAMGPQKGIHSGMKKQTNPQAVCISYKPILTADIISQ